MITLLNNKRNWMSDWASVQCWTTLRVVEPYRTFSNCVLRKVTGVLNNTGHLETGRQSIVEQPCTFLNNERYSITGWSSIILSNFRNFFMSLQNTVPCNIPYHAEREWEKKSWYLSTRPFTETCIYIFAMYVCTWQVEGRGRGDNHPPHSPRLPLLKNKINGGKKSETELTASVL